MQSAGIFESPGIFLYIRLVSAKLKIVALTGAGVSAESGLGTFRDYGGLWEQYRIEDVATPEGWAKNPALVTDFYNLRRRDTLNAQPNAGHYALAKLEAFFDVEVITQNIDDLHERAGSSKVLHLHGKIMEARSSINEHLIYPLDHWEVKMGDTCELGSQLRPNVVWFGEMVPNINPAAELIGLADILIVAGTSLQVYPAAGLIYEAMPEIPKYVVDPNADELSIKGFSIFAKPSSLGLPELAQHLIEQVS
jgi:NAD-dependent deacetylase